jgi:hypothetical protein
MPRPPAWTTRSRSSSGASSSSPSGATPTAFPATTRRGLLRTGFASSEVRREPVRPIAPGPALGMLDDPAASGFNTRRRGSWATRPTEEARE